MKKLIFKSIAFVLALTLILASFTPVFVYKVDHRGKLLDGLYESDDEYDVVLMGSSHMNGGVDPNVLWKQQGITSFNYATGGQPIAATYYLLREVLKKRLPSVVVLDTYYLGMTTDYGEMGLVSNVLDNMRFSVNKLEAIRDCVPPEERLPFLLPVLKYHFRWSTLTPLDFSYDSSAIYYLKGFAAGTGRYGKDDLLYTDTENRADVPAKTLSYLYRIIDLAHQYRFSLVFVNMPSDYRKSEQSGGWVTDCEAMFNTVADLSAEEGIPFLDLCDKVDELGIDFAQDMNNSGHLNVWGAYKVSTYLGKYLKQNFPLADHRSDPGLAEHWNKDYSHSFANAVVNGTVEQN